MSGCFITLLLSILAFTNCKYFNYYCGRSFYIKIHYKQFHFMIHILFFIIDVSILKWVDTFTFCCKVHFFLIQRCVHNRLSSYSNPEESAKYFASFLTLLLLPSCTYMHTAWPSSLPKVSQYFSHS